LHARYVEGAAMHPSALATWVAAFARWLPVDRPLSLADIGSGTGRFTPSLAAEFGGPVFGIEPSNRMRTVASTAATHPQVRYIGGQCEAIPLVDRAVSGALLFGVWHHVVDRSAAAAELARVIRSDGTLLLRTSPSDRLRPPWWNQWFPELHEIDRVVLPSLAETTSTIAAAGWQLVTIDEVEVQSGLTRRQEFERLRNRALSTFEYIDDEAADEGLRRIERSLARDAAAHTPAPVVAHDLLVFAHR
jgi:ubiquinone/menaquinone biosynthesis C-methylase UbiE